MGRGLKEMGGREREGQRSGAPLDPRCHVIWQLYSSSNISHSLSIHFSPSFFTEWITPTVKLNLKWTVKKRHKNYSYRLRNRGDGYVSLYTLQMLLVSKSGSEQMCMSSVSYETIKLSCSKDDRAMRHMYGCPENFRESLTIPTATFPEIFNVLLFRLSL